MSGADSHIINALCLTGQGGATVESPESIVGKLEAIDLAWVDMKADHEGTAPWLHQNVAYLDDIVLEALLADETRPRAEDIGDGVLALLRGVNLSEGEEPEDMVSLRIWADPHRIITLHRRPLRALKDMEQSLLSHNETVSVADFIAMLCRRLVDRMEPTLLDLEEAIDGLEEKVIEEPDRRLRRQIVDIRTRVIMLRRYIAPQKEAIMRLANTEQPWMSDHARRSLRESYDRTTRFVETLDMLREHSQIIQDELTNTLADVLNRNMYLLSVVAAIFLPLGFLTGLLGINVGGIPGSDNPDAFWWFGGGLFFLVIVQMIIFKRLKWI